MKRVKVKCPHCKKTVAVTIATQEDIQNRDRSCVRMSAVERDEQRQEVGEQTDHDAVAALVWAFTAFERRL